MANKREIGVVELVSRTGIPYWVDSVGRFKTYDHGEILPVYLSEDGQEGKGIDPVTKETVVYVASEMD